MSFPEEPFNLSVTEGGGYYPATIHQKLKGDKYEIVRKLGYGPRSSTWLVLDTYQDRYFAVKIFTVAASEQARRQELAMLRAVGIIHLGLPVFHESLWEKSDQGDHLCIVMNPLSNSLKTFVKESENHKLRVSVVQRIACRVAKALEELHGFVIMHGAVKADNILFTAATQTEDLKAVLDSEPAPSTVTVKRYTTVQSQPLSRGFKRYKNSMLPDWNFILSNFGHAQQSGFKPEKNEDYLSAPETLLEDASCSIRTDIWMLGVTTFHLLTGTSPFSLRGNPAKQIATMCAVLQDECPEEWLGDKKMRYYNPNAHGYVTPIDAVLAKSVPEGDVTPAAAFIKACLRLDPKKRLAAGETSGHKWLEGADS